MTTTLYLSNMNLGTLAWAFDLSPYRLRNDKFFTYHARAKYTRQTEFDNKFRNESWFIKRNLDDRLSYIMGIINEGTKYAKSNNTIIIHNKDYETILKYLRILKMVLSITDTGNVVFDINDQKKEFILKQIQYLLMSNMRRTFVSAK